MMKSKTPARMRHGFCAVRHADDGDEWLDMSSYASLIDMAREKAAAMDAHIPGWAKANPVVRIANVAVEEIR